MPATACNGGSAGLLVTPGAVWQDGNGTIDADEFKALLGVEKVTLLPAQQLPPPPSCMTPLPKNSINQCLHAGGAQTRRRYRRRMPCHAMRDQGRQPYLPARRAGEAQHEGVHQGVELGVVADG